jgi:hypothetical protein
VRPTDRRRALRWGIAAMTAVLAVTSLVLVGAAHPLPAPRTFNAAETSVAAVAPAAPARTAPPMSATGAGRTAATGTPDAGGWNSNFFHDVEVTFAGPGLPTQFQLVPYTNDLPTTTLGFWVNVSSLDPLRYANLTIWGTQWPASSGLALPITGFTPQSPNLAAMQINRSDPNVASYFFDLYRFFWPGSTVYFNVTAVGVGATPAEVASSTNDSIPVTYPGGYTNLATWAFTVDPPWSSGNFSNDIAISTSPDILGPVPYEPNPDQSFSVTLTATDLGGTVEPIPAAILEFTVIENGQASSYSESFGPVNHTVMTLTNPIGPYPGATVEFNVSAWLPWQGGVVDPIQSPTYGFNWSARGGWWFPTQGLLTNLDLGAFPNVLAGGIVAGAPVDIATDQPVNVSIHESVENVSIGSAVVNYVYADQGLAHSGSIAMTAVSLNSSYAVLPGLPPGAMVTFYVVAKDINGDPVSSGNFSYAEVGPTTPPLPEGRGLLFLEVLDLTRGTLVPGFGFTISNATWSESANATALGFGSPTLPGTSLAYQLGFGAYDLAVTVFGVVHSAEVTISPSSPTPTIVFYAESSPLTTPTTGSAPVATLAAAAGLVAAAIATVPLSSWLAERRARAEEEQQRVTL